MRDEELFALDSGAAPDHNGGIYTAVLAWFEDPAAAKARYGPIASWDTSSITSMFCLFYGQTAFNEDLARWQVGQVKSMTSMFDGATSFNSDLSRWQVWQVKRMNCMFYGATSFTHQLGGAWSTSTAYKSCMFYNSPGTIVGKTKAADGTIA